MSKEELIKKALEYHEKPKPGKLGTKITKEVSRKEDLALAYSPGVAYPVLEIAKDNENAYRYTNKGNLIAVISNGTAILGLGDLGAQASKPVMEGKAMLFKLFADIDVYDIEINTKDPDEIIRTVKLLEPTFGGINLEDIKAPECFYIEEKLNEIMNIPVFHDDQHGTAIVAGAGLLNALIIANKKIEEVKIVINGAGAAGIACARHFVDIGAKKENIFLCDSQGVVTTNRTDNINKYKLEFAQDTSKTTLEEIIVDADVFVGVSVKDVLTPEMLRSMASNPIVFALANPDPEINYELAKSTRPDVIIATGRSDYPNQINNVLAFPYIFRIALDRRLKKITKELKIKMSHVLAELAREEVPDELKKLYPNENLVFGRDYFVPKVMDKRIMSFIRGKLN
ncbi:MAG: malate dehydrogenase [Candidatus Dojkabacteria bacterium]|nr:malate dehydrogenase [Candidatus Dojkabacteria bacterium]